MKNPVMKAIIVPFYNEKENLGKLIQSLSCQRRSSFRPVFVNSRSTDGSVELLESLEEVRSGSWILLDESRRGQLYALYRGLKFCVENKYEYVGIIDADSYVKSRSFLSSAEKTIDDISGSLDKSKFGYIFGPVKYDMSLLCDDFSNLTKAVDAYETILLGDIYRNIGWFACGSYCFFESSQLLDVYRKMKTLKIRNDSDFDIPENDLRISMELLRRGRKIYYSKIPVFTSPERLVSDPYGWAKDYYNYRYKSSLSTAKSKDISGDDIRRVLLGRAQKIVTRNLVPLMIVDRTDGFIERASKFFSVDLSVIARYRNYYTDDELIWSIAERESMICKLCKDSFCRYMINFLYKRMNGCLSRDQKKIFDVSGFFGRNIEKNTFGI